MACPAMSSSMVLRSASARARSASRRAGAQGYGRFMGPARFEAFAIQACRSAGTIPNANQALPSCQQGLDLTGWAVRSHPNRERGPSVGNPIFQAVRLRAEQTS
jgi:hypothetical protein